MQQTRAWFVTMAGALLVACSSGSGGAGFAGTGDDGGGSGSSSSSSGAGSSSGSMITGASSSGSGSSSGGTSGGGSSSGATSSGGGVQDGGMAFDSGVSTGDIGQTVTLTATPFQVAAGAEVYKCEVFANPFAGATDLVALHGTMSAGSHHFFLFNINSANAAVEPPVGTLGDCSGGGIEFHPYPFLSQQPDWTVTFPKAADGSPMGYPLAASSLLMINVHYLNASAAAITANVKITIEAARSGVVKTHVGTLFLNQNPMNIPVTPMTSPVLTTKTWGGNPGAASTDGSYTIFTSWSHMHRWGLDINASTNGQVFYDETNWDSPGLFYHGNIPAGASNPATATGATSPVHMTANQGITWTCKYYNDTAGPLTFGDSAKNNVMCIYMGQYYPADPNNPDVVDVVN